MTENKTRLLGSGNKGKRSYFILEKDDSFFSLFPKFLLGCGFKELDEYDNLEEEKKDISDYTNRVENYKNAEYDIDVVFTQDRIVLIVRTENRDALTRGIKLMTD